MWKKTRVPLCISITFQSTKFPQRLRYYTSKIFEIPGALRFGPWPATWLLVIYSFTTPVVSLSLTYSSSCAHPIPLSKFCHFFCRIHLLQVLLKSSEFFRTSNETNSKPVDNNLFSFAKNPTKRVLEIFSAIKIGFVPYNLNIFRTSVWDFNV